MKLAYVDTSCLVAIALGESGSESLAARLQRFDRLFSSNLLEAELRSALAREGIDEDPGTLTSWITWVYPNRPLTGECKRTLSAGRLKGADLWHIACALSLSLNEKKLSFLTLDRPQREAASKLGFPT